MKRFSFRRFILPFSGIILFLVFPGQSAAGVRSGLLLCAQVLLPSLFPIGVLAGCLVRMDAGSCVPGFLRAWMRSRFDLPGDSALPFFLGLLGGFPLGAQLSSDLYENGRIPEKSAKRLSALCNQAGPAFLLGAVSAALGSPKWGVFFFLVQLLSALLTGVLLKKPTEPIVRRAAVHHNRASFSAVLPASIRSTAFNMLVLTGSVCFFQAVTACLFSILPVSSFPPVLRAVIAGFLELSGGISLLRGFDPIVTLPLAAFLINWGGVSVHLQAAAAFHESGLSADDYLIRKLIQAFLALLLTGFYTSAFVCDRPVYAVSSGCILLFLIFFSVLKKSRWKKEISVL